MRTVPARYVLLEYRTLLQMNYPVAHRAPGSGPSIHTVIFLMALSGAYNINDLRTLAQRRLPRVAWDYLERGAEDDVTMTANRTAFEGIHFRPRTLVDVSGRSLQHELFGRRYAAPFGIAPTGAAGLYWFDADVALARAAAAADARLAEQHGADGVVVSNHGGRQLDGAMAAIDALPEIVDAVSGKIAVLFDSGVRRGSDIVKAMALGADFVFCGRATLYGASVGGEAGVSRALELLHSETDRVMALIGCNSVDALDRNFLKMPDSA